MLATADSVRRKIENLMNTKLDDDFYEYLVSLKQELSDAVTTQIGSGAETAPSFNLRGDQTPTDYILNRLGHIAANPSDPERNEFLKQVFCFSQQSDDMKVNKDSPNYNKKSARDFLKELIALSYEERDRYVSKKGGPRRIYLLHGPRGIGKTFFINYLFTEFHDELNNNKVIWVRINIPEGFSFNDDPDLIHWLRSKICLVVFRYYRDGMDFEKIVSDTKTYINTVPEHLRTKLHDNLEKIIQIFSNLKGPEKLISETVEDLIARHVVDLVIKNGYSFIFTLDGIDQLDITPRQEQRIRNIYRRLGILVDRDTLLGGCYVLVVRTESLDCLHYELDQSFSKMTPLSRIPKQILETPFEEIVKKRTDFLIRKISKILKSKWPYHYQDFDFHTHFSKYINYLNELANQRDIYEFYQLLNDLYGVNNRAKVHLLQLCYYYYLSYKYDPLGYKLVETMTKAGFKYPPRIYHYEYKEEIQDFIPSNPSKIFDNVFLPTLFHFPYAKNGKYSHIPHAHTYILANLRILQVLRSISFVKEAISTTPSKISARKFINLMTYFGYKEKIIYKLMEELSECGIIMLLGSTLHATGKYENLQIQITPKLNAILGGSLLGHLGFFADMAYLNMCAMRIVLNRAVLEAKQQELPFIRALTLEDSAHSGLQYTRRWIIWKLLNAISIFRILDACNQREYNALKSKKKIPKELSDNFELIFNYTSELSVQLSKQIKYILNELENRDFAGLSELDEILGRYESLWVKQTKKK